MKVKSALQGNRLARVDGFFFGFANFDGALAVARGDDRRGLPTLDGFEQVAQLDHVTIRAVAGDGAGLALFDEAERVLATRRIVVGGRVLEINGVGHRETEAGRHRPATLGLDEGAGGDLVL